MHIKMLLEHRQFPVVLTAKKSREIRTFRPPTQKETSNFLNSSSDQDVILFYIRHSDETLDDHERINRYWDYA